MDFVVANYHTLFLKIGIFLERLVYQSLLSDLYNRKNRGISRLKNKIIKYRVGFGWILVAISPISLLLVSLPIGYFISGSWLDFRQFITDNLFSPISTFLWILPLISYGIFEEIGWRGFALPYLQKNLML